IMLANDNRPEPETLPLLLAEVRATDIAGRRSFLKAFGNNTSMPNRRMTGRALKNTSTNVWLSAQLSACPLEAMRSLGGRKKRHHTQVAQGVEPQSRVFFVRKILSMGAGA
ncbi:MAG: hypothetical protein IPL27_04515, partial [Lewinellaceae bacterium]|nr:hypothetical protein [Lewinellaceae bacterium]